MSRTFVVATAADRNFAPQVSVLIASLSQNMPDTHCVVFVLQDGFSDQDMAKVASAAGTNIEIEWLAASSADTRAARLPDFLSPATTFRLRLPELLPSSLEQLVYLDADVLVRRSIADLADFDLADGVLGAVRDPACPLASMALPWRTLGIDPSTPYFNAGVLVVGLARWRAENVGPRAFDLLRSYDLRWGDNCALNAVAGRSWTRLAPEWNLQGAHFDDTRAVWGLEPIAELTSAVADPRIVHFSNPPRNRPWNEFCSNPYADEWWDLVRHTAWSDLRPPSTTARERTVRRVKKAAYALLNG